MRTYKVRPTSSVSCHQIGSEMSEEHRGRDEDYRRQHSHQHPRLAVLHDYPLVTDPARIAPIRPHGQPLAENGVRGDCEQNEDCRKLSCRVDDAVCVFSARWRWLFLPGS